MNCPISSRSTCLLAILPLCACLMLSSVSLAQQTPATPNSQQKPPPPTPEQLELQRLNEEGVKAYSRGDFPAALKAFQSGLEKAQAINDDKRTAKFLNNIGIVYDSLGQNEKALDFYQRALTLREKIGNPQDIAASLNGIGNAYFDLGQKEKALDFHQRALTLDEKIGNPQEIAESLGNIGAVYSSLGQNEKALDFHQRSLTLFEKSNGNPQKIAASLNGIGNAYFDLGQKEKALDFHQRALTLDEKIGNPQDIAESLGNIGAVYSSLGQNEKALDFHQRALTLREKIGNPQYIAASLNGIGNAYFDLGQKEKALDFHQRALTLDEKIGNPQEIAESLGNIGAVYSSLGQNEKALDFHQRALTLFEKSNGNKQDIARSLNGIGNVYYDLGQNEKALIFFQRALTLDEKIGNPQEIAGSLGNIGNVYANLSQNEKSLDFLQRATSFYEKVGEQVSEGSEQGRFQETTGNLYARTARTLLLLKRSAEALTTLDRGKGQGLSKQVQRNRLGLESLLSPADATELAKYESERTTANKTWQMARQRTALIKNPKPAEAAEARLRQAESAYSLFYTSLLNRKEYTRYRQLLGFAPPTFAQLARLSRQNPDTLYLEYAPLDENKTLLFALLAGKVSYFNLPVREKRLKPAILAWREAITASEEQNGKLELKRAETPRAKQVSSLLLNAVEKAGLLAKAKRLVVVTEGNLADVPFSALLDSKGRRLIERFPISSVFSLASLLWEEKQERPAGKLFTIADTTGSVALQIGEPVQVAQVRAGLRELESARKESLAVAALYPSTSCFVLIGAKGREETVKAEMGKYALLHFAVHGEADGKEGVRSKLILAPEPEGSKEDGMLEAREISGMKLRASLAVLSACQSAQGQKSSGEGLIGLAWAFRAAGVPAIVASQWKVNDEATKDLMVAFYRGLKAGKRKDDALRDAMLSVMHNGNSNPKSKIQNPKSPYFWAAFQVIGKTDPVR